MRCLKHNDTGVTKTNKQTNKQRATHFQECKTGKYNMFNQYYKYINHMYLNLQFTMFTQT